MFFHDRCVATARSKVRNSSVNFEPLLFRAWRCSGSAPTKPMIVT